MLLNIQYKDFSYQYVDSRTFGKLLANKTHRIIYRPSEERSVNVYHNPFRGLSKHILKKIRIVTMVAFLVFPIAFAISSLKWEHVNKHHEEKEVYLLTTEKTQKEEKEVYLFATGYYHPKR